MQEIGGYFSKQGQVSRVSAVIHIQSKSVSAALMKIFSETHSKSISGVGFTAVMYRAKCLVRPSESDMFLLCHYPKPFVQRCVAFTYVGASACLRGNSN